MCSITMASWYCLLERMCLKTSPAAFFQHVRALDRSLYLRGVFSCFMMASVPLWMNASCLTSESASRGTGSTNLAPFAASVSTVYHEKKKKKARTQQMLSDDDTHHLSALVVDEMFSFFQRPISVVPFNHILTRNNFIFSATPLPLNLLPKATMRLRRIVVHGLGPEMNAKNTLTGWSPRIPYHSKPGYYWEATLLRRPFLQAGL